MIRHVAREGSTPEFRYLINDTDLTMWMRRGYEPEAAWSNLPGLGWQQVMIFQFLGGDGSWTIHGGTDATAIQVCTVRITPPTAGHHHEVSSNTFDVRNTSSQSVTTGMWPPGGKRPARVVAAGGFPWHTIESVGGWVMHVLYYASMITGLIRTLRRSRRRPG